MLRVDPRTLRQVPIRIVLVTMDTHLASAAMKGVEVLSEKLPGLQFKLHAASDWAKRPDGIECCIADIKSADIIIVTMLFLEDHFQPILKALEDRRETCDAMICAMSAPEVVKLTRMNQLDMMKPATGLLGLLKRMRGKNKAQAGGAAQMRMLRRLPKILRYIPGSAQDARAYFLTLQYWLGGSQDNIRNMLLFLIERYAKEERVALKTGDPVPEPVHYPDVGLYHPKMTGTVCDSLGDLPDPVSVNKCGGTVGLILLRSYLLAGNTGHYDGVISAMENRGLKVIPVFASGLDARPAIERYFMDGNRVNVDAVVSLTGFSLVGGPAYNDAKAAEEVLAKLDCPYIAAHPVEFQSLDEWGKSERGLSPVESTIMVAIPELDGGTVPMVFGGRLGSTGSCCGRCERSAISNNLDAAYDMASCPERAAMLAARTDRLVSLRKARSCDRKIAIVLFNFPPNAGATGTAAYLGVFESLFNTLDALKRDGHKVDMPESVEHLRDLILDGNAAQHGADANVHHLVSADDYVRREPYLADIEAQWGPAPGKGLSNGRELFVLGRQFGNVFVGIQPPFGYEGDPMRLLFESGFTPTHAFSAFYRYLREDFGANAVLHFGTHGALEFMPGKQTGLSSECWPDRLIQDLPNLYLYASNNPSEGALAKRRAGATLISYLTPPVTQAGLYKELAELKSMLDRWRSADSSDAEARSECVEIIKAQAEALELKEYALFDDAAVDPEQAIKALSDALLELEYALIPHGMHVVGKVPSAEERFDLLTSMVDEDSGPAFSAPVLERLAAGDAPRTALKTAGVEFRAGDLDRLETLSKTARLLKKETELDGIVRALSGRFIRPAPGGDLLRSPEVLPTGRNLHGFDPFRIPSAYAVIDGAAQANRLIDRYRKDGNPLPNSIAMVLWGTDNLKREGSPIAQALALMGAKPRFDSYGRLAGAELIALEDLGRPRIDVVITISGIFRDLLPLQIKLLAEASLLAASADEPLEKNYIRKNALTFMEEHNCDLETAALRVYGNADGAYGANVNHLIDSSSFGDDEELAEAYSARKGFAYGVSGTPQKNRALLASILNTVELTYQNLDSVELGVTTIDNYFDTLGGITGAVKKAKGGKTPPVYIGDQTRSSGTVRTLSEQVALETRTRALNPKWYEGMLSHGYEGVRQIEEHVKNTLGWSATTGQVQPWVYQKLTETFMLDPDMRDRLAELNPVASSRVANRLIEASERDYWQPDEATLEALMDAADALDDRVEGVAAEPGE